MMSFDDDGRGGCQANRCLAVVVKSVVAVETIVSQTKRRLV